MYMWCRVVVLLRERNSRTRFYVLTLHRCNLYLLMPQPPRLPSELLIRIFQQVNSNTLQSCARVCSHWYFPAVSVLWHSPQFSSLHNFVKFLETCYRQGLQRRCLPKPTARGCISESGLGNMRVFDVGSCSKLNVFIGPKHLALMADAHPPITSLSLAHVTNLGDAALAQIVASTATTLISLDLTRCWRVSDLGVQVIAELCGEFGILERLVLRDLGLVSSAGLVAITNSLTHSLSELDVGKCRRVSEAALMALVSRAVRLNTLRFPGCRKISRTGFLGIVGRFAEQREGNFLEFSIPVPPRGSPNYTFVNFPIGLLSHVTRLHIHRAEYLSDTQIRSIATNIGPQLIELSLMNGTFISEAALEYLFAHCERLSYLSLRQSPPVTDKTLRVIALSRWGRSLRHLDLTGCKNISSLGVLGKSRVGEATLAVAAAAEDLQGLEGELEYDHHGVPPDDRVLADGKNLPRAASLTVLILTDCSQIPFSEIQSVALALQPSQSGSLTELHVTGGRYPELDVRPAFNIRPAQTMICSPNPGVAMDLSFVAEHDIARSTTERQVFATVPERVGIHPVRHRDAWWVEILRGEKLDSVAKMASDD
ncbi:hypothetical protein DFS34DRAFT_181491 [Phlyctochytrium arcticum]|nr:hypothetical protein DFS34DRAFT_181491 [Phlyctochytrium arcticum]